MVWQNTVNFFFIIIVENFFQKEFVIIFLFSTYSSQPEVSKYCADLMPLLLGYLSSLNQAKVGHVTKAFYALENFMENLGELKKKKKKSKLGILAHCKRKHENRICFIFTLFALSPLFISLNRSRYWALPAHPDGDHVVCPQQHWKSQDKRACCVCHRCHRYEADKDSNAKNTRRLS